MSERFGLGAGECRRGAPSEVPWPAACGRLVGLAVMSSFARWCICPVAARFGVNRRSPICCICKRPQFGVDADRPVRRMTRRNGQKG